MHVLVTGGAGYIGSIVAEYLLDRGWHVTIFDSLERGYMDAVDKRAKFVRGNLSDSEILESMFAEGRFDGVMHFAAYALVGESVDHPELYFRNNVEYGRNLLVAMKNHGVSKLIFSSTCATYGEPETMPITEEFPTNPVNPYGESKLRFEQEIQRFEKEEGLRYASLRYFNAAGASEQFGEAHEPETHIIPLVMQVATGLRESFSIYGDDYPTPDGTCIRDYIHILDLAEAHMRALERLEAGGGSMILNLGTGNGYSVHEVISTVEKVTGRKIATTVTERRPGDPPILVAGADLAASLLEWRPVFNIDSIISTAWNWHRKFPRGYSR